MKRLRVGLLITLMASLAPIGIARVTGSTPIFVSATDGAVGSVTRVQSLDDCIAAPGAVAWTALVRFVQGGTILGSVNAAPAGDGNWSGSIRVPTTASLGAAQLTAQCFDPSHTVATQATYTANDFTVSVVVAVTTRISTAATASAPADRLALGPPTG